MPALDLSLDRWPNQALRQGKSQSSRSRLYRIFVFQYNFYIESWSLIDLMNNFELLRDIVYTYPSALWCHHLDGSHLNTHEAMDRYNCFNRFTTLQNVISSRLTTISFQNMKSLIHLEFHHPTQCNTCAGHLHIIDQLKNNWNTNSISMFISKSTLQWHIIVYVWHFSIFWNNFHGLPSHHFRYQLMH